MNSVMLIGTVGKTEWIDGQNPRATATIETDGFGKFPDRHRCVAWRDAAEKLAACDEGTLVYVAGRLQTRSYDQAGEKKWITEVVVSVVRRLAVVVSGDAAPPPPPPKQREMTDEELPF